MALDERDRVYADGSDIAAPCMWFALCENEANGLREGPIRGTNGGFGPIPICKRCDDKCERLSKENN